MPWSIVRGHVDCAQDQWAVVKDADGSLVGCHSTEESAQAQLAALHAAEPGVRQVDGGVFYRSFTPDLEVRAKGDGRTIYGIAVPYRVPVKINARLTEQWAPGAFNHQLRAAHRVKLSREHLTLGGTLIGALTLMRDDPAGLYIEARTSRTPVGDETLELVKDRALEQLSVGFNQPRSRVLRGGIVERTRANLFEVAVTLEGAYGEFAAAAGVRAAGEDFDALETPRLEEAYQVLDDLPELGLPPAV